jgi:aromatic-L-amino-acid decarboxylase
MADAARMHVLDERMLQTVLDYVTERLREGVDVPLDRGRGGPDLLPLLEGLVSPGGNDAADIVRLYDESLSRAVISCDSPRYLAFIPAAPTKASLLFDMIVSAASLQGVSWLEAAGAIVAENQALRWIADLAGLPASAGGVFVTGGSAGNLSALAVARDVGMHRKGLSAPVRVAVSDQAHSSIANALHLLGMKAFVVHTPDARLDAAALRAAFAADPDAAAQVVAVAATSGTTNAGIVDDLAGISEVAREFGLWFHVDGAYGGAGLLAPSVRHKYAGIENVDSLVVDPHKWLFAPFDCAALLYRDPHLAKAVHTQDASYLDVIHAHGDEEWNPSDYAHHLTRRARGLPLWFSLVVNGTDAYRDAVEQALTLARETARRIEAAPHLELLREPDLSVVLFRRIGWDAERYDAWSQQLLDDQIAFITPTSWLGETVARLAFLNPQTTMEIVDEVLATMVDA